ncbi:hypothetical protein D3C76_1598720 [compost metagenome]
MHRSYRSAISAQHGCTDGHITEKKFLGIDRITLLAHFLKRLQDLVDLRQRMAGVSDSLAIFNQHQRFILRQRA